MNTYVFKENLEKVAGHAFFRKKIFLAALCEDGVMADDLDLQSILIKKHKQ